MLKHQTEVRIRYADTDQMKYVYNGKYFEYFEVGRAEMMREINLTYKQIEAHGYYMPVHEVFVKYISPAYYDEVLIIESRVKDLPQLKVHIDHTIISKERNVIIVEGYIELVFLKAETMKPTRPPKFFLDTIKHFFHGKSMILNLDEIIKSALDEDIQSGDITSLAIIPPDLPAYGKFLIKQDGIIAGLEVAEECFKLIDNNVQFKSYKSEGDEVRKGEIAAEVAGSAISLLTVERTALNFLQRMSGIASLAHQYSEKIKHTKAKVIDTRKTAPGLRMLDKLAVKAGGCNNHRIGLYDMFLIKDNHIAVASQISGDDGAITKAVRACKEYRQKIGKNFKIEVETKNLDEVKEALAADIDVIMLDNFTTDMMHKAVEYINSRCLIEASGNVNLDTVKEIAETGVDLISVGALTHSVKALDISLDIQTKQI